MEPVSRVVFTVLIALFLSGLATADPSDSPAPIDPSVLRAFTFVELDLAFESFVSEDGSNQLTGLAGPTLMECSGSTVSDAAETCLVTVDRLTNPSPAALANR